MLKILLRILIIALAGFNFLTFSQIITDPDSSIKSILKEIEGTPLKLSDAQQYALKNASPVIIAEAQYSAALGTLRRERGFYDPELFFNINYDDRETPAASFFSGANVLITKETRTQSGIRWNLPVGTQLQLALNTNNLRTNSGFAFLNPQYDVFGSLSFRQPLLAGFSMSTRKNLSRVELEVDAAKERYDQQVLAVSSAVELMYWNLYAAERDFAVQKLTRDRAETFLKETILRQETGLVEPNQVANARTSLAEQELLLIDRQEQLDSQSDQLAKLLGVRPEVFSRYKAIDNPPANFPVESVDELISTTLKNSLELKAAQKDIDAANVFVEAAFWEALPRVDLVGSLVSTGLGGTPHDIVFGNDTLRTTSGGSFGDALNQVAKREFPGWNIGLELTVPIGLRSGLGEKDRIEAETVILKQQYIELSRNLEQQIRSAHRELSNGNARLKAASEGVQAAQEQVRIGIIQFQNGQITAFELTELNEDFAVAQRRYSDALIRTVNASARLKQLTSGMYTGQKL